jgi:hypothetical protein
MANTYYISTNPELYGSDATDDESSEYAENIAERASAAYPDVEFVVTSGQRRHDFDDDDLLASVQQTINDNWADWID